LKRRSQLWRGAAKAFRPKPAALLRLLKVFALHLGPHCRSLFPLFTQKADYPLMKKPLSASEADFSTCVNPL
jgi:hypothetical protein